MRDISFLESAARFEDKLTYTSSMRMETTLCPLNAGRPSQHAMRQRWIRPLQVVGSVQRMSDFEWSVYNDIFVEEDIARKLLSEGFSGFEFRPAELFTTTETPIGRPLFELRVTGWGGMAHPSSGIRIKEKCPRCGRTVYTNWTKAENLFDVDRWDGTDFFLIWPMPKYVFITDEVAKFISREGFTGLTVRALRDFPGSIAGGYSPGHIEDWYEEEQAKKIIMDLQ